MLLLLIPCGGEPIEELAERLVIVFQLLNIVRFARTAGRMDFARDAVLVVGVRDVAEGDRNPSLLHLRDIGEGRAREQPIEPRKARLVELVGDRLAVEIVHRRAAAGDRGIHVFPSEQPEVAVVAARFVGQEIGPRVRIASADPPPLRAMDRETDKVSLGKVSRRGVRRRSIRCLALR